MPHSTSTTLSLYTVYGRHTSSDTHKQTFQSLSVYVRGRTCSHRFSFFAARGGTRAVTAIPSLPHSTSTTPQLYTVYDHHPRTVTNRLTVTVCIQCPWWRMCSHSHPFSATAIPSLPHSTSTTPQLYTMYDHHPRTVTSRRNFRCLYTVSVVENVQS